MPQEPEIDGRQRPDIRVTHPKTDPISIEVKWADSWSFWELENGLEQQLVGQYLSAHNSRFGSGSICTAHCAGPARWMLLDVMELIESEVTCVGRCRRGRTSTRSRGIQGSTAMSLHEQLAAWMRTPIQYRSNFQKGGALLEDMRILVRAWNESPTRDQKALTVAANALGKRTRARVQDTVTRAFVPRFVNGDPPAAWRLLQPLEKVASGIEIVRPVYYWVTARSERILYDFVTEELFAGRWNSGRVIAARTVAKWIASRLREGGDSWSSAVQLRVAQGMLAALRDFGILEGTTKKRLAPVYIGVQPFAYLAFALHRLGTSGRQIVQHPDWRLFLMSARDVEHLLLEAHQQKLLSYAAAGNIVRIEFPATTWEEMADVITERAT